MNAAQERKRRVLELLTLGRLTKTEAAGAVGITPRTINDWLRENPAFKSELDTWQAGPPLDAAAVRQSRRVIVDELAKRLVDKRDKMSVRDLLGVYDRLTRESTNVSEKSNDHDVERPAPLSPEEARRIWTEREAERQRAAADPADGRAQS